MKFQGIKAESTILVQEWEGIDTELERFNLNEIRGKCNHNEIEIYELEFRLLSLQFHDMFIFNEGMVDIERPVETVDQEDKVRINVLHVGGTNSGCQSQ